MNLLATVPVEAFGEEMIHAPAGKVSYKVAGNRIEICVPLESIGITSADKFIVDFKWIDNAAGDGNIQTCMRDGDSAPDGRFRYRYKFAE